MNFRRPAFVLGGAACVGLGLARLLNELVPDALGIGVSMFAAGALGGFVAGILWRERRGEVARGASLALERARRLPHGGHDE